MYPQKMLGVEIIVLKSHAKQLIKRLHELGLVHLKLVQNKNDWVHNAAPPKELDELSLKVRRLRDATVIARELNVHAHDSREHDDKLLERIIDMNERRNSLKAKTSKISERIKLLEVLEKMRITSLPKNDRICIQLFETEPQKVKEVVLECEKNNLDFEFYIDSIHGKGYVAIGGSSDDRNKIRDIAKEFGMIEIQLPDEEIDDVNAQIGEFKRQFESVNKEIKHMEHEMHSELSKTIKSIRESYEKYNLLIERAKVISKFGESKSLYFIEGWIRKKDKETLENALSEYKKYAAVSYHKPKHGELAPTSLKTPKGFEPFKSLLTFVSIPRSDEIDPTSLIAITLPIMFGMIVGDIGYSLVLIGLSIYFAPRLHGILKDIMKIIMYSSLWGVIWGAVFGEFLGFELEYELFGINFPIISRLHAVMNLLLLTVAVGAVHLALGNALSAIEGIRHRDIKHAVAKICWVTLEVGVVSMIINVQLGAVITVISLLGIVATEGAVGIIEVPGLLANVMSYTRIAAVGLSGVILAFLINMMRPDPSQGLLMIVAFIAFAAGHFAAICLAAFESLIQGGRLHAVEFFSKFFKGGGIMFNPFRIKMR